MNLILVFCEVFVTSFVSGHSGYILPSPPLHIVVVLSLLAYYSTLPWADR